MDLYVRYDNSIELLGLGYNGDSKTITVAFHNNERYTAS